MRGAGHDATRGSHPTGLGYLWTPLRPCARREMTTTTLQNHPPRKRRRGYAVSQSGPASPGCPTYGVAKAVQGEDVGGRGGAASVGGAHVSSPARRGVRAAAGSAPCRLRVPLPSASSASGSARQDARPPRRSSPGGVRAPRVKGTVRNDNNSTQRRRGGRKVSGPHGSTVHRGREDEGQRAGQ